MKPSSILSPEFQVVRKNKKQFFVTGARPMAVLAMFLMISTSGCALNPYVAPNHPVKSNGTMDTSLDAARKYANDLQALYRKELGRQAILQNSMGGGLITAGATALGLAAYGAHTDAILGVGLGTGTGYALGQWYINNPRQRTYIEGIKGIHCAKAAILPLDISEADMARFKCNLNKLSNQISKVSGDIGVVEAVLPMVEFKGPGTSELTVAARSNLEKAKTLMENAARVLTSGESLMRLANSAGARLMNSVEKISIEVDLAIQEGSPKLSAIPDIVRGLSDSSNIFVPGLNLMEDLTAAFASSEQEKGAMNKQNTAVDQGRDQYTATGALINAMAGLNTSARDLTTVTQLTHGFITEIREANPVETLAGCGVKLPDSALDISLTPAALTFTAKKTAEKIILVEGGTKPYATRILETTDEGLTVHSPIPGDSIVRVTVSDKTKPGGPYQLLIMDATMSHKKIVPVTIQEVPAGDKGTEAAWKLGNKEDIKIVQRKLCTKEDGDIGDDTKLAIRVFQEAIDEKPDGNLTQEQFNTLKNVKDCKDACPTCLNYFERDLGPDEIAKLRENLGLGNGEAPGTIENDMRDKIKRKTESKDPEASKRGQVTKALQDQINGQR